MPTPNMAMKMGLARGTGGGWIDSLSLALAGRNEIELHYFFFSGGIINQQEGAVDSVVYHALPLNQDDAAMYKSLEGLVTTVRPDIVHIFGSEFIWFNLMVSVCVNLNLLDRTVLHVQGLISVYAKHYALGVPFRWRFAHSMIDLMWDTSVWRRQKGFERQGRLECESIARLRHISGRTDWDRACAFHINPKAQYHHCGEVLRQPFYTNRWELQSCEKHRIFLSQATYPVKGFHFLLEAMPLILRHFPNAKIVIAGYDNVQFKGGMKVKLTRTGYNRYLYDLIKKNRLDDCIHFTGPLDENGMCAQYLRSHVFVSSSTIENSPNSLGEAMLLGMPCVASFVGGVPSMLRDKKEGFLYQVDAPYMLAYHVMEFFRDDDLAAGLGNNARARAMRTHDKETILLDTLSMYGIMMNERGQEM